MTKTWWDSPATAFRFDWKGYLAAFHGRQPGLTGQVLGRAFSGAHTPHRWLARAVSPRVRTVVDVCCGGGAMTRELARPGRTVFGVDLVEAELTVAAESAAGPWVCADALALPFPEASMDAVTSSMGVAVVGDVDGLFREVARVLKPGGVFAFTAPSVRALRPFDLALLAGIAARLRTVPQFPTPTELTGYVPTMAGTGLRKVEDARERYVFTATSVEDVRLLMDALYLPFTESEQRAAAADYLEGIRRPRGSVGVPIPMRRFVAIRTSN